eukprot:2548347-Amphidinium_carterae.2
MGENKRVSSSSFMSLLGGVLLFLWCAGEVEEAALPMAQEESWVVIDSFFLEKGFAKRLCPSTLVEPEGSNTGIVPTFGQDARRATVWPKKFPQIRVSIRFLLLIGSVPRLVFQQLGSFDQFIMYEIQRMVEEILARARF